MDFNKNANGGEKMNTTVNKLTMTVEEMGRSIGISRVKAYELANTEGFPKIRIGRRIIIPIDALNHWLKQNSIGA
jgi:excisionase family DNA binding protein